jgi:hypothetical protein
VGQRTTGELPGLGGQQGRRGDMKSTSRHPWRDGPFSFSIERKPSQELPHNTEFKKASIDFSHALILSIRVQSHSFS